MKKLLLVLAMALVVVPSFAGVTLTESGKSGTTVTVGYNYDTTGSRPRAFALTLSAVGGTITSVTPTITGESVSPSNLGYGIFPGQIIIVGGSVSNYGSPVEQTMYPGAGGTGIGQATAIVALGSLYSGDGNKPGNTGFLFTVVCSPGTTALNVSEEGMYRGGVVGEDGSDIAVATLNVNFCTPPGQATNPSPINGATGVAITGTTLSWTAGSGVTNSYNVYRGTTSGSLTLLGNTTSTNYPAGTLANSTTYYWRVDSIGCAPTTGTEWNFTTVGCTQPAVATAVAPTNGQTAVPVTTDLSWTAAGGTNARYDVYFGQTSPGTLVSSNQAATTFDTGTMLQGKTYYWQIVSKNDCNPTGVTSSIFSFVTYTSLPVGKVFTVTCNPTVTLTVTADMVTKWNYLNQPACWTCDGQKCGNGTYTPSGTLSRVDTADFGEMKLSWYKTHTTAGYKPCSDYNLSGRVDTADFGILKQHWYKTVGSTGCQ